MTRRAGPIDVPARLARWGTSPPQLPLQCNGVRRRGSAPGAEEERPRAIVARALGRADYVPAQKLRAPRTSPYARPPAENGRRHDYAGRYVPLRSSGRRERRPTHGRRPRTAVGTTTRADASRSVAPGAENVALRTAAGRERPSARLRGPMRPAPFPLRPRLYRHGSCLRTPRADVAPPTRPPGARARSPVGAPRTAARWAYGPSVAGRRPRRACWAACRRPIAAASACGALRLRYCARPRRGCGAARGLRPKNGLRPAGSAPAVRYRPAVAARPPS